MLDIDEFQYELSTKDKFAQLALANNSIKSLLSDTDVPFVFNKTIKANKPITDQKKSGRCWLFSTLNVFRKKAMSKYGMSSFEFSENYLFFYSKMERANYFMHNIIRTRNKPLDSRLVQQLLDSPMTDGGKFHMAARLIQKYGVIPADIYPDTPTSQDSKLFNSFLSDKLREYALVLREDTTKVNVFLKEIYHILVVVLGKPPLADSTFEYDYTDSDDVVKHISMTPIEFWKSLDIDLDLYMTLVHDPRYPDKVLYTRDFHTNMVESPNSNTLNVSIDVMKSAIISSIKDREPVWFACDIGKYTNKKTGIMSLGEDYSTLLGPKLNMTKEQRISTYGSSTSHDMVIVGVHLDEQERPIRWKLENSWGSKKGSKGTYVMNDSWLDEYGFQIAIHQKYMEDEYVNIWNNGKAIELPYYEKLAG